MRKNYVLDTNVLLADADSIYKFEENNVYIPMVVIDELDGLKESKDSETAYNARRANRALQMIQKEMATDGHTAFKEQFRLWSAYHTDTNTTVIDKLGKDPD